MFDELQHPDAAAAYDDDPAADKKLQHDIMMDLFVTVTGFGAVVTLILLVVQGLI